MPTGVAKRSQPGQNQEAEHQTMEHAPQIDHQLKRVEKVNRVKGSAPILQCGELAGFV